MLNRLDFMGMMEYDYDYARQDARQIYSNIVSGEYDGTYFDGDYDYY